LLEHRLAQFRASTHPLVYTPGDNEWTDCAEVKVDPLARLAKLRSMFFIGERSLGKVTMSLIRQSTFGPALAKYRENVRWDKGGVSFVALHVVGSNNGLGLSPVSNAEYVERNKANLLWLRQAFEHASAKKSRAVMIFQQAGIFPAADPNGFTDIRVAIQREAIAFRKPVVLVHGDGHYFRVDKPFPAPTPSQLAPQQIDNLTRVEAFGQPNHHWVEVSVVSDPNVFSFQPRIVVANSKTR
jgi:hypothetical protein